jgi:hypothetical protein
LLAVEDDQAVGWPLNRWAIINRPSRSRTCRNFSPLRDRFG